METGLTFLWFPVIIYTSLLIIFFMKLSFHGACREVTGSCACLTGEKFKMLIDCGFFQGDHLIQDRNRDPFPFEASEIDFILLTHAHLDHCGRLPKLYREGFRGRIYCTPPTKDLTEIILLDTLKIITENAEEQDVPAIFSEDDVAGIMKLFHTIKYHEQFTVNSELSFIAYDAGHILGSSSFKLLVKELGKEKVILFSGDLGNPPAPLMNDPELLKGADFVVIESTYGGKEHENREEGIIKLRQAIKETASRQGVLLIPIFALEKVQEIIYELNNLVETHQVPLVSCYLDSPLATRALNIYKKYEDYFDEDAKKTIRSGDDIFSFPGFNIIEDSEESRQLTKMHPPKIIMAGSGMLNGGRMPKHLIHEIYNTNAQLLFVSYQSEGTLGRKLQDGAQTVRIENQEFDVKIKVSTADSFSAHSGEHELELWLNSLKNPKPRTVFVVHGEDSSNQAVADFVDKKFSSESIIPEQGVIYDL
ncbi:MAG: MBL fold metallo-hydrolase [Patescibacteria group bacterium]